jgi:uncharacterized SAM-binding protein YcdF (DUF218 family)
MPIEVDYRMRHFWSVSQGYERFVIVEAKFISQSALPIVRRHYDNVGTLGAPTFQRRPNRLLPKARKLIVQQYVRAA